MFGAALPERGDAPTSKAKAKKEARKEAKKGAKKQIAKHEVSEPSASAQHLAVESTNGTTSKSLADDPDYIFKVGFLADTYKERPVGVDGINSVVTRCKSPLTNS